MDRSCHKITGRNRWNMHAKFKVSMSQKGSAVFIVLFILFEAALIGLSLNADQRSAIMGMVIAVMFFLLCFAAELTSLLFKVQVIDSIISVRTRIGRCYNIHISEITKIVCETGFDKEHGHIGEITIKTANRKLEIDQTMNGFQEMAGYILEKLDRKSVV